MQVIGSYESKFELELFKILELSFCPESFLAFKRYYEHSNAKPNPSWRSNANIGIRMPMLVTNITSFVHSNA